MKKLYIILGSIIGIIFISLIIWYVFFDIEINLIDGKRVVQTINIEYKDAGFTIKQHNKDILKDKYDVKMDGNVDVNTLGEYKVSYDIKYRLRSFHIERIVEVKDNIEPEIKANIESMVRDYCTKKDKSKLEYTIVDNYDGNSTVYVSKGSKYSDSGVTYTDGCGNKLEGVTITGKVDTSKNGDYTITYTANGNKLTRKVTVYTISAGGNISSKEKVIYLTFDDGPGSYTEKVLNTLAKYNVKATFFVTHQFGSYVSLIKKEYEQGHSVGVHSYTHNWNIYKSVDAYVNDFNKMNNDIFNYTGSKSRIFRFPGGSSNTISRNYAKGVVKAIASRMTSDGYAYFDWDVDSGDASGASRSKIYSNVVNGVKHCSKCIVLMHDIKANTVNELDNILNTLVGQGYRFGTLSVSSPTVHHSIAN